MERNAISYNLLMALSAWGANFKKEEDLSDESKVYVSGFMDYLSILQSNIIKSYEKIDIIDIMLFLNNNLEELNKNFDNGVVAKKYFYGAMSFLKIAINYVVDTYIRKPRSSE